MDKHFLNLGFSVSPIWILFYDPCALPLAKTVGVINFLITAIEHRNKKMRVFYIVLTAVSWTIVWDNFRTSEIEDLIQKPISRNTLQGLLKKYA